MIFVRLGFVSLALLDYRRLCGIDIGMDRRYDMVPAVYTVHQIFCNTGRLGIQPQIKKTKLC